jgi:hypothetical protein
VLGFSTVALLIFTTVVNRGTETMVFGTITT